jgi:hypothetical protein
VRARSGSLVIPMTLGRAAQYTRRAPSRADMWPTCNHCSIVGPGGEVLYARGVRSVHLVDQNRRSVVILAKCHGQEEAVRIDFETDWTPDDLKVAYGNATFFRSEMCR